MAAQQTMMGQPLTPIQTKIGIDNQRIDGDTISRNITLGNYNNTVSAA